MPRTTTTKSASPSTVEATMDVSATDSGTTARRTTKAARLVALLEAPGGASLAEMGAALGWQAHTIRAAMSGLRKAGRPVERQSRGDETVYVLQTDVTEVTAALSVPVTALTPGPTDMTEPRDGEASPEAQS